MFSNKINASNLRSDHGSAAEAKNAIGIQLNPTADYIHALVNSAHFRTQVAAHHFTPFRPMRWRPFPKGLPAPAATMLRRLGMEQLYSHQLEALSAIADGRHTVVATPTASGKTFSAIEARHY
jgi:DEAD/DEAH box helicase domain-containing protein